VFRRHLGRDGVQYRRHGALGLQLHYQPRLYPRHGPDCLRKPVGPAGQHPFGHRLRGHRPQDQLSVSRWISPLFLRRLRQFKSIRRSYWSLLLLTAAYGLSLGAEFIANNRPIIVRYEGRLYVPVFFFYPERTFGGKYGTITDYKDLRQS